MKLAEVRHMQDHLLEYIHSGQKMGKRALKSQSQYAYHISDGKKQIFQCRLVSG